MDKGGDPAKQKADIAKIDGDFEKDKNNTKAVSKLRAIENNSSGVTNSASPYKDADVSKFGTMKGKVKDLSKSLQKADRALRKDIKDPAKRKETLGRLLLDAVGGDKDKLRELMKNRGISRYVTEPT